MTETQPAPGSIDIIDPVPYEQHGFPHDTFTWLRKNDPVHWHPDPNPDVPGFWAVTKHADVTYVSRHSEIFSSRERGALFEEWSDEDLVMYRQMMLNMDPPQHTRQRAFVNRGFTPRMIAKLAEHVRDISHQLIDDVCERGAADFVEDIAAQLPIYVICEMLGAPVDDRKRIFNLSNHLVGFDDPEYSTSSEESKGYAMEIYLWASELAAKRRQEPRDDIITQLLAPDEQGEELTDDELCMFVLLLLIAGNETVRNGSSGGMLAFFDHPDQWQRLLADHSLFRTAADEIVRYASPVSLMRRMAVRDVELNGKQIKAGDKVVVFYSSANRDEDVFEDPFAFDITRTSNPHIGFGAGGAHFCLGTHLARLELSVLFQAIAERMPDIHLAGTPRRLRSNFIIGFKEIPVRFTPSPKRGVRA